MATAQPFTWARLIYGRLTRSSFKRMCAPKSPCFRPSKLFPLQGISAFGLGLLLLGKALAGSSAFGLSETFLVSVRLGLI